MQAAFALVDSSEPALGGTDIRRAPRRKHRRVWVSVGVLIAAAMAVMGLHRLRAAAPKVDASAVVVDQVQRGEMVHSVHGDGQLVPEEIRWITSSVAARVERVLVRPGAKVDADTLLLELSNPDLELQLLDAQRQVAATRSELANIEATFQNQRLTQESLIASLRADVADATRRDEADTNLGKRGLLAGLDVAQAHDHATSLNDKLGLEQKRLDAILHGAELQIAAQKSQLQRLEAIAAFRLTERERMHVRAGMPGILQDLTLQEGQSVLPGGLLAKVARPDRLKAEVHVAELEAKDVKLGQLASVDLRDGVVKGKVTRVDPNVQAGVVTVDISLEGELPQAARPDLSIEAAIEIARLANVLYVGRPAGVQPQKDILLFKLSADGTEAARVHVKLGRASSTHVEVTSGLGAGDHVVLSDTSAWDHWDRVRIR